MSRTSDISRREFFRDFFGKKQIRRVCAAATDNLGLFGPSRTSGGPEEAGLALAKREGEPCLPPEPATATAQASENAQPGSWFDPCGEGNQ